MVDPASISALATFKFPTCPRATPSTTLPEPSALPQLLATAAWLTSVLGSEGLNDKRRECGCIKPIV